MAARRVQAIADTLNISIFSLRNWMKKPLPINENRTPLTAKHPRDRWPAQRLDTLHDSHRLLHEALKAWCRERLSLSHQFAQRQANSYKSGGAYLSSEEAQVLRILKAENQRPEHALKRKERALPEAAALLITQKNYHALLGGKAE
jgi:hypothetical protein